MTKLNYINDIDDFLLKSHATYDSTHHSEIFDILSAIEKNVRLKKDAAIKEYTLNFDATSVLDINLIVSQDEIEDSNKKVTQEVHNAQKTAIENITAYHQHQYPKNWSFSPNEHTHYGVQYSPIHRAGLYVPGGRAPYPSTVIMDAIPAKIAGVEELIMTTPPGKDGQISPYILSAAHKCGITKIIKAGGAQAIFGLAYGTESIPKVDKIVGPGNIYVDQAKQRVYGKVDIDKPAGPSDVTVYVEESKYASFAASEILAQLEHDPLSIAIAISPSKEVLNAIQNECEAQKKILKRETIINESLKNSGLVYIQKKEDAASIINKCSPEHLVLLIDNYKPLLKKITAAGSIFCGAYTPVTLGDYYSGPNHVLPTNGTSRFASPLGVMDFMKYSSFMTSTKQGLSDVAPDLKILTDIEGFDAHYNAVHQRLK
jgi:histidinol dehydrogenase